MSARWRTIYVLLALALAGALPGVFSLPVMDRDEARFTQATTQMMETGDYVAIRFQDQLRNKKPVGIHWLQAASVALLSDMESRSLWAYRMPSVLGAVLAVLATYWAGCILVGRRAAFAGAALLSVCVMLGIEATLAKTDAMLVGLTALAMAALARLYEGGGKWSAVLFWIAIGAGVLIKGPITPMIAFLGIIILVIIDRRVRWLAPLAHPFGPLAAAAIVAPWLVGVQMATDGQFLAEALGSDLGPKLFTGHESHGAWPGTHLAALPILFWPGTLFLVPGLVLAFRALGRPFEDHRAGALRFLLAWTIPAWLIFEVVPTKLPHYTLPLYPALALMAGAAVVAIGERAATIGARIWSTLFFAAAGLFLAALIVLAPHLFAGDGAGVELTGERAIAVITNLGRGEQLALAIIAGACLLLPLALWRAPRALLVLACAAGAAWHMGALQFTAPRLAPLFIAEAASTELFELTLHPRLSLAARRPLAVAGYSEPSLIFMTATDTVYGGPEQVAAIAAAEPGRAALVERRLQEAFENALTDLGAAAVIVGVVEGLNYSVGEPVELIIYRTTQPARGREAALRVRRETAE